tara:strand:- start:9224 stop:9730 length:507 start_codon:yes stop_codon:yes gene_type:complete
MNFLLGLKEKKKIILRRENFFYLILIISIFVLDRLTKSNIINNFSDNAHYVNDFINFDLIWNTGIGFGFLSSSSNLIYNLITILIGSVIIFLFYLFLFTNKIEKIIFSIIIGGALGNFYDRIIFKAVPDFIDLHYNSFHWFTFNIADIFITLGIFILFVYGLIKKENS